MSVAVVSELVQFPRHVDRVPEEYPIEILVPDRAYRALSEGMRNRDVRNRLDLLDLEYA